MKKLVVISFLAGFQAFAAQSSVEQEFNRRSNIGESEQQQVAWAKYQTALTDELNRIDQAFSLDESVSQTLADGSISASDDAHNFSTWTATNSVAGISL